MASEQIYNLQEWIHEGQSAQWGSQSKIRDARWSLWLQLSSTIYLMEHLHLTSLTELTHLIRVQNGLKVLSHQMLGSCWELENLHLCTSQLSCLWFVHLSTAGVWMWSALNTGIWSSDFTTAEYRCLTIGCLHIPTLCSLWPQEVSEHHEDESGWKDASHGREPEAPVSEQEIQPTCPSVCLSRASPGDSESSSSTLFLGLYKKETEILAASRQFLKLFAKDHFDNSDSEIGEEASSLFRYQLPAGPALFSTPFFGATQKSARKQLLLSWAPHWGSSHLSTWVKKQTQVLKK